MSHDRMTTEHTREDWIESFKKAVHTISPGMHIIAGIERHRRPVVDAMMTILDDAGPVDPSVIPRHPIVLRKTPFMDFYSYGRLTDRDDIEEAFSLAFFRPVIVEMHTLGLRSTFRRLEGQGVHEADLGLLRSVCCMSGEPRESGEILIENIRFFDCEAAVMDARSAEFAHSYHRQLTGHPPHSPRPSEEIRP